MEIKEIAKRVSKKIYVEDGLLLSKFISEKFAESLISAYKAELLKEAGEPVADGYFYRNPNGVCIECDPKHREEDGVFPLYTSDQLAASQLHTEQLREAIEQYLAENDPSEFGCACDLSVGHLCGPCFAHKQQTVLRKALAIPRDTSAIDAYVSEKVKEATEKLHYRMEHCYSIDGMKAILDLDEMTRQRDLAVEALRKCRYRSLVDKVVDDALDAIKESDGK